MRDGYKYNAMRVRARKPIGRDSGKEEQVDEINRVFQLYRIGKSQEML